MALLHERARLVASAAAMLVDVLNPELLVVAEAGAVHLPGCMDVMRAEIAARARTCLDPAQLVIATSFGSDVLPLSAAAVMLDTVYAEPLQSLPLSLAS